LMYLPRFWETQKRVATGIILRLNQYCSLAATLIRASDRKLCNSRDLEER
jgi:hypothetical protein